MSDLTKQSASSSGFETQSGLDCPSAPEILFATVSGLGSALDLVTASGSEYASLTVRVFASDSA